VSSILTYDVYKRYINPNATDKQILQVGHWMVVLFALCMALAGVIFYFIGVSMGWLYLFMGVILGSAVAPIALCVTWSKANKWGCIGGSVAGFVAGIVAWLVTTSQLNNGVVNVVTSGGDYEMLAGNLASIGVGGIVAYVASIIAPENYDFAATRAINLEHVIPPPHAEEDEKSDEKRDVSVLVTPHDRDDDIDPVRLNAAFKFATWSSVALTLIMIILVPLPLFFASTVYGVAGFTTWVVVSIIWTFVSATTVVLYPLYESRGAITRICVGIVKDIFGGGAGKYRPEAPKPEAA